MHVDTHRNSYDVGGCSNCHRFITSAGDIGHRVANVVLNEGGGGGSMSFRLCDLCRAELRDLLA